MAMVAENRGRITCCPVQVSYMEAEGNNAPRKKCKITVKKFKITSKGEWDVPEDKSIGSTVKDIVGYGKRDRIAGGGVKRSGVKIKVKEPTMVVCIGKRRPEMCLDGERKKKLKMDRSLKLQISKILNEVMNHHSAGVFKEPVDPVKLRIPDYFSIITKPMDLGTVQHKLEGNMYHGADEFAADVRLTFSNAMTYNPPGNPVHMRAEILDAYFSKKWKPLDAKLKHGEKKDEEARLTDYMGNNGQCTKQSVENNQHNRKPIGLNKAASTRLISLEEKEKFRQEFVQELSKEMEKLQNVFQKFGLAGVDKETLISYIDSIDDEALWKFRKEVKHRLSARDGKVQPGGKIAVSGCSSLNKTVEKGHCSRSALACAASANLSKSIVASTEARCSSRVSRKCPSGATTQVSASDLYSERSAEQNQCDDSKLECEVKYPLESLTSSSGRDSEGPEVVVNEANSFHLSTPAYVEGWTSYIPMSPKKALRAAMLKKRFADTIFKATHQELLKQSERSDPLRKQQERERLEREQQEEKARIEAQIKAAKAATRRKQNDLKMRHEAERKAARTALEKIKNTVGIDQNVGLLKDLETKTIGCGYLYYPSEAICHGNPLEQLGLYVKDDDIMEEDEVTILDKEEGEIPL